MDEAVACKGNRLARLRLIVDHTQKLAASGILWVACQVAHESLKSSANRGRMSNQCYNITLERQLAYSPSFSTLNTGLIRWPHVCMLEIEAGRDFENLRSCDNDLAREGYKHDRACLTSAISRERNRPSPRRQQRFRFGAPGTVVA